ncbi:hypothetical protein BGZ49_001330 [Haplosporangium sp. Z 27]|nr:hypothetical protein BGZ49_001330 [Haplosporangium sp. Z 27]
MDSDNELQSDLMMDIDEEQSSSYILASSQIDAQFEDVANSNLIRNLEKQKSTKSTARQGATTATNSIDTQEDQNQDWEWVEETEYIVMDFGGAGIDAKDMEKMTASGFSLIGLDTAAPYFKAGIHSFKGFWDENAITEDLIFEMEARDEAEEGVDDSDEENNTDTLNLTAIVTKRIIFEPIELVPIPNHEEPRKDKGKSIAQSISSTSKTTDREETPTSPTRHKDTKMSIWKAAYDAVGIQQKKRKKVSKSSPAPRTRKPKSKRSMEVPINIEADFRAALPSSSSTTTAATSSSSTTTTSSASKQVDTMFQVSDDNDEGNYGEDEDGGENGEEGESE